jgi:hypothetical protein
MPTRRERLDGAGLSSSISFPASVSHVLTGRARKPRARSVLCAEC